MRAPRVDSPDDRNGGGSRLLSSNGSRMMSEFWQVVGDIAAVVTIIGMPYLVVNYRKRAPRFSFGFAGSSREEFARDGIEYCRFRFEGSVRNLSLDPNTIDHIHLVVWKSRRRRGTRSFGYSPSAVQEHDQPRTLPLAFGPREAKRLTISFAVALTGSHDAELVRALEPVSQATPGVLRGTTLYLPKYQYELAFKDVTGNLFDQNGLLRNEKGIGLRWTLENTFRQLKDGHPMPFVRHLSSIAVSDAIFFVRRNLRRLGL
jgi:hypothetical protein